MTIANRARRSKSQPKAELNERLLNQLLFVAPFVEKSGYFLIFNGWLCSLNQNGEAAAIKTELDFSAAPHFENFKAALEQCREEVTITVLSEKELSISSGDFEITINCIPTNRFVFEPVFPASYTFENQTNFKESIKKALLGIKHKLKERASLCSKIFIDKSFVIGTNAHLLVAAQTNENLPGYFYFSEFNSKVISSCESRLVSMGSDGIAATFYFEDESFYHMKFAEFDSVNLYQPLEKTKCPAPDADLWEDLPAGFFETVKSIKKFSEKDKIVFESDKVYAEDSKAKASFKIYSTFEKMGFQLKYLLTIENVCKKILTIDNKVMLFTDGHCVGVLMGLDFGTTYEKSAEKSADENGVDWSDDIPF
jgi:hypothetical protein